MKVLKHKLLYFALILGFMLPVGFSAVANAACVINGEQVACPTNTSGSTSTTSQNDTLTLNQDRQKGGDCIGSYKQLNKDNCQIIKIVVFITKALSGMAGLVIIAMMIVGGIQYSMAGADPSKVQAAKQKIYNAIIALLLLVFGFAILQWLVPGGIF